MKHIFDKTFAVPGAAPVVLEIFHSHGQHWIKASQLGKALDQSSFTIRRAMRTYSVLRSDRMRRLAPLRNEPCGDFCFLSVTGAMLLAGRSRSARRLALLKFLDEIPTG